MVSWEDAFRRVLFLLTASTSRSWRALSGTLVHEFVGISETRSYSDYPSLLSLLQFLLIVSSSLLLNWSLPGLFFNSRLGAMEQEAGESKSAEQPVVVDG